LSGVNFVMLQDQNQLFNIGPVDFPIKDGAEAYCFRSQSVDTFHDFIFNMLPLCQHSSVKVIENPRHKNGTKSS